MLAIHRRIRKAAIHLSAIKKKPLILEVCTASAFAYVKQSFFLAVTVFESTNKKRPKDQRKRLWNLDSGDVEGYTGPWGAFVDEERIAKPDAVGPIFFATLIRKI